MSGHTPGPWRAEKYTLFATGDHEWLIMSCHDTANEGDALIATLNTLDGADAHRIVACVNALEGMNPVAVAQLVEALQKIADEGRGGEGPETNSYDAASPAPNDDLRTGLARVIAKAIVDQDYEGLPDNFDGVLAWLDQGETDMRLVADAAIAHCNAHGKIAADIRAGLPLDPAQPES